MCVYRVYIHIHQRVVAILILTVVAVPPIVAGAATQDTAAAARTVLNAGLGGQVVDVLVVIDLASVLFERRLQGHVHAGDLGPLVQLVPHRIVDVLHCQRLNLVVERLLVLSDDSVDFRLAGSGEVTLVSAQFIGFCHVQVVHHDSSIDDQAVAPRHKSVALRPWGILALLVIDTVRATSTPITLCEEVFMAILATHALLQSLLAGYSRVAIEAPDAVSALVPGEFVRLAHLTVAAVAARALVDLKGTGHLLEGKLVPHVRIQIVLPHI